MGSVSESIEIDAPPEAVWGFVGDPAGLSHWHPAIAASPVTGDQRVVTLADGGELQETIVEHRDEDRRYTYAITAGPFPLRSHSSQIAVDDADGGSRVTWSVEFEATDQAADDELSATFPGIFRAGLESVRDRFQ